MPGPILPPEAFNFTEGELIDICHFDRTKDLGGLEVRVDESLPATGWDPDVGENGLIIPAESRDFIMLHVPRIRSVQTGRHDLALAGSYVGLHPELSRRELVVAATYEPVASLAVRAAGFSYIKPYGPRETFQAMVERRYGSMQISRRRPLRIAMLYMPTSQFIESFANPRLGRNAQALLDLLTTEEEFDV